MTRLKRLRWERKYRIKNKLRLQKYRRSYEKKHFKRIRIYREKYKLLWRKKHPIRFLRGNRNRSLKKRFGIDYKEYLAILKQQHGKCLICGTTPNRNKKDFAVDHCHKTNKVRGLLCSQCNVGLGYFRDSQRLLRKAIYYLQCSKHMNIIKNSNNQ